MPQSNWHDKYLNAARYIHICWALKISTSVSFYSVHCENKVKISKKISLKTQNHGNLFEPNRWSHKITVECSLHSSVVVQFVGSFQSLHFPAVHIRGHCLQQIQPTFNYNSSGVFTCWYVIYGILPLPQTVPAIFHPNIYNSDGHLTLCLGGKKVFTEVDRNQNNTEQVCLE